MPPRTPFRTGEIFREATEAMGLHSYPTPVAANSVPYNGFPANTYTPWSGAGFGPYFHDRWYPALTSVPEALATGNFDLRTHCRVVRVLTDPTGRANGVEYVDAASHKDVGRARASGAS
jgi:gluconate 2-dehydrogenase alpha chain